MTQRRRIAGVVGVVALGATALAACSSEEERPTPLRPLVVREQASSVAKTKDGYRVNWAGVLANGNRWHFGENVVATIVGRDATGKEVLRTDQPLDAVPPAGTLAFSGLAVAKRAPAKVAITYNAARWKQASRVTSAFQTFPVTEIIAKRQGDGGYLVTGRVGTPYRQTASSLVVTALLRDRAGRLLGGASAFVDDVSAEKSPRFILTLDNAPAKVEKADVVAQTWGSTARPYEELAMGGVVPVFKGKPKTPPFAKDRGRQLIPGVDIRQE